MVGSSRCVELTTYSTAVRAPVNSFEFQPCGRTPQVDYYCVNCGTEGVYPPTPSNHRLRCGLPGYLILFATHTFEPQRQLVPSRPPSPLVFLRYLRIHRYTGNSAYICTTQDIQFESSSWVEPMYFTSQLAYPPALPLHPVIPDNACDLRFTAAAGT